VGIPPYGIREERGGGKTENRPLSDERRIFMKRFLLVLMILTLLLGVAGCRHAPMTTVNDSLTEADVLAAYKTAAEAYSWFDMTTIPLDDTVSQKDGDHVYNRADVPGIKSMSDLTAYLNSIFTPQLTNNLLNLSPSRYRDFNGVLYAEGADRGSNIFLQDKQVKASQTDATHWAVTLTFFAGYKDDTNPAAPQITIGYSQTVLDYQKTDDGWRFTTFCPNDNLDSDADTVYEFTYDSTAFSGTSFDLYSDFQLCCYLLNADGGFAEGPSDLLFQRFLKNPQNIVSALSVVAESPWENKNIVISDIGYTAAAQSAGTGNSAFEAALNSLPAAQSDAEKTVRSAISDAYKKGMADAGGSSSVTASS
jgi:hypothetical protein